MNFPTSTRTELRRAISRELGMKFFKTYESYLVPDAGSSNSFIIDADLGQGDDEWNDMWFYVASDTAANNVGLVRRVSDFGSSDNKLSLESAVTSVCSTGTQYEIHNIFSPFEIHQAINRAIQEAYPSFFDMVEDETLVVLQDTLDYDISSLTYSVGMVSSIWLERPVDSITGAATETDTSSSLTIIDSNARFYGVVKPGWLISIYDKTGKQQLRTVSQADSHTQITVTSAWTTKPAIYSKYRTWDPLEQRNSWFKVLGFRLDNGEFPSSLYLNQPYSWAYGGRIQLQYSTPSAELTAEASTTTVPKEYIINKAIGILASSRVYSSRTDRNKWAVMAQMAEENAQRFKMRNAFRMTTTMPIEVDPAGSNIAGNKNPLGW